MQKEYKKPTMETIELTHADIITNSNDDVGEDIFGDDWVYE